MNGIILYKSKYGATKKYADWLSEKTGFPCVRTDDADINEVVKHDVIILGGGVYASGIAGLSFLRKNIKKLAGKKILVFMCCASPYEPNAFDTVAKHNLRGDLVGIPCFYCRGKFSMADMTFPDRMLCRLLRKTLAKKNPNDYEVWEKAIMSVGEDEAGDWTDISYIDPIIAAL